MVVVKAVKVPERKIDSITLPRFDGGLFTDGRREGPLNSFIKSKDIELDKNGFIVPRRKRQPFLPDTVGIAYQKAPTLVGGEMYYFTLDNGKAKYCQEGDSSWTDCGGSNSFTTNNGGMPIFIRTLDCIFICNGKNGDKLAHIDLSTSGFPVVKYGLVTNPTNAPTAVLTGLTGTGSFKVYYAWNYSGSVGETELSPILTQTVNVVRDQWASLSTPGSIKLTRSGTVPTGARYWNVYMAVAATSGTIQPEDMLRLAARLDLAVTDFVDDGTIDIDLSTTAPLVNNTDGPRVSQGVVEDGNPILFMDEDNPYAIHIGGGGPYAMDFTISNGGYKAEPEKGTNYYPTVIVGFRTGTGVPAMTVLYSNTEGLSKQSVLQQQTVTYGDSTFSVWGVTEQHYGAAGVAAANSAINYNGKLLFLSTDGFMAAQTQASLQNVMSIIPVSSPIDSYIRSVKNNAMKWVVGTGWDNKYMWLIPNAGFDTPQQIAILDTNSKGIEGHGAWYTVDIAAQWIGVVSPANASAFVYISQGTKTYKLEEGVGTYDVINGVNSPFSTGATGPIMGMGSIARNQWFNTVQVVFEIENLIGEITVGVTYTPQGSEMPITSKKTFIGPEFVPSSSGGWGDTQWNYDNFPSVPRYAASPLIDDSEGNTQAIFKRIVVPVNNLINESQWFFNTPIGYNNFKIRPISYEGINLGVKPDL